MKVITHQISDRKLPTEDIDKHQINMDKAHQIFHINKWINKPTESKPLAYSVCKPACAPKPTSIIFMKMQYL